MLTMFHKMDFKLGNLLICMSAFIMFSESGFSQLKVDSVSNANDKYKIRNIDSVASVYNLCSKR
jgi:hypothetical protein